jgi:xylulose-5-phosphate/fructose-6-phosphate phosphoketolase
MTATTAELISPYGPARSTVKGNPLDPTELASIDAFWRASCYLAAGMIYLQENPLLREPLRPEQIKNRLLGHWGSSPGLAFIYTHLNRVIKKFDQEMIYLCGPGHGAPGILAPTYLEGTYSEVYPEKSEDLDGLKLFMREFSFPGGIGSHCTPETPGSIHEGGELGYVLSHACGAAFDNPNLICAAIVGDGESETGPLATAWHINKFLNPARDGAVLPILHLNGYKINNPTILARIPHDELSDLFRGLGYTPYFVEGSDPQTMHQAMAATLDRAVSEIRDISTAASSGARYRRSKTPMIILRSPKGWTFPREIDGQEIEGTWRAHQVPLSEVKKDPKHLAILEKWLKSYRPEELFDQSGRLIAELRALTPQGEMRMSASPHVNGGGRLRRALKFPDFRNYAVSVDNPGAARSGNTRPLGKFLRDIIKNNPDNFRLFGPDETTSNKLDDVYEVSKKLWLEEYTDAGADGDLSVDGRVIEMLSEHTLEGMLEGYVLTGRHGLISTYEAFVHVIDSMFNQHAKWLSVSRRLPWRQRIASLNMLITSTVWRQDHNGFTHQDPGFLDLVTNKRAEVTRIYLPPDANCLLSVADHCLRSENYVNVIVSDKQNHLQYLSMEEAVRHCSKGIGIWEWACTDHGREPDLVMAAAGDIPTCEALAASVLLREAFPDLKIRFINVVDLYKLTPQSEHPHGLSDEDFDSLFTVDKPILFNFHGYPWLIHRLAYRRRNHENLHVRGYKEQGNINTPLELAIENQIDRFSLAIDAINRVEKLGAIGGHVKEKFKNMQIDARNQAHKFGIDRAEYTNWTWPS